MTPQQEASRPVVTSISMNDKDNYVNFSDTDSSTDYFHGYSLGINHLIDWLTKDNESGHKMAEAASVIKVDVCNNDVQPKHIKRLERIAKAINYKIKTVHKRGVYRISENQNMCYIQPYDFVMWYIYDASLISEDKIIIA